MPKEVTRAADFGSCDEHRQIEVRWSMHQYVEVATVNNLQPVTDDKVEGVFLTLDRPGINRLIRALRKARDQAYGADA